MKTKRKLCNGCNKMRVIWKNHEGKRYCQQCWSRVNKTLPGVLKPTNRVSLPPHSLKRSIQDKEYSELRKTFLLNNPLCQAHIPGICLQQSTDIHHKKGRGKYYLDTSTWLSVCRLCHDWIHLNSIPAKDLGFYK